MSINRAMVASQQWRFFFANAACASSQLNSDGAFVNGVIEKALISSIQLDGKQRMGHWVHHTRSGLLWAPHSTTYANGSTVLPTQLREVSNDDHDSFNGVLILKPLSSEVAGGISGTFIVY